MICNFLGKFVLLLSGSARCFGLCFFFFFFLFFYSSSYKYNCLVQDCGRVLYTVSFSQLKGFFDMGRPPFFKFHEKWILLFSSSIVFEYIHFQLYVWNFYFHQSYHLRLCGSSTQEFSSPRLEYGGEFFLLHHQDRVNWFLSAYV